MRKRLLIIPLLVASITQNVLALDYQSVKIEGNNLKVNLISSAQCAWGDLDLIALDLREHKQKESAAKVIVSVESFDGKISSALEPDLFQFILGEVKEIQPIKLNLPSVVNPTLVGIYVCKDSSGTMSCRNNNVADYKSMFKRHMVEMKDGKSVTGIAPNQLSATDLPKDNVYYFQPAILSTTGLQILTEDFTQESLGSFKQEIITKGLADKSIASIIDRNTNTLLSGALQLSNSELQIDLPSSDQGKCSANINKGH